MVNHSTLVTAKVLEFYQGFQDVTTLVDISGGHGITLNMITSKYPNIQAINFDLPHVIQHAPPYPGISSASYSMMFI